MIDDGLPNSAPRPDNTPRTLHPHPHISHSQVDMYDRCSWQYYMHYVQGKNARPSLNMVVGSGGHEALEYNAKTKIRTGTDLPLSDLLDKAADLLDAHIYEIPTSELDTKEDPGKAKDDAIAALASFRIKDAPLIRPIAAEWDFLLDIPESDVLPNPLRVINGKVDVLEAVVNFHNHQPITEVNIRDYKWVGQMRNQQEVDQSRQLVLYDIAYERATGRQPASTGYRLFLPSNTKNPARQIDMPRGEVEQTPEQRNRRRDRLFYVYQTTQRGIDNGVFIPTDDPKTCSWCGFRKECQYSLTKSDYDAAALRGRKK